MDLYVKHGSGFRLASAKQIRAAWMELNRRKVKTPGAKRKLTQKQADQIVSFRRRGVKVSKLCESFGISRATCYRLLKEN